MTSRFEKIFDRQAEWLARSPLGAMIGVLLIVLVLSGYVAISLINLPLPYFVAAGVVTLVVLYVFALFFAAVAKQGRNRS